MSVCGGDERGSKKCTHTEPQEALGVQCGSGDNGTLCWFGCDSILALSSIST